MFAYFPFFPQNISNSTIIIIFLLCTKQKHVCTNTYKGENVMKKDYIIHNNNISWYTTKLSILGTVTLTR